MLVIRVALQLDRYDKFVSQFAPSGVCLPSTFGAYSVNFSAFSKNEELNRLLKLQGDFSPVPLHLRMDIQRAYLRASGRTSDELANLNIVHVAGSKGKGSTCAYIECMLRHEGYRTGLITSPHLINVEERIRINGKPVERELFAEHFWMLYDKFNANAPIRFRLLQMKAFYRASLPHNCYRPRVTVVAAIELEHTDFLGDTIREVAWNKAGIFKPGVAAVVATDEPEDAMAVFTEEAEAVQCPLFVAPRFVDVQRSLGGDDVVLSDWQRLVHEMGCPLVNERNVCLALAAVSLWHGHYSTVSPSVQLDPSMRILSTRVVGRFHEVQMSKKLTFYVDCAHTAESIRAPYIAHFAVHCNWKSQSTGYAETAGGETLRFDVVYFAGFIAGGLARIEPKLPCPCQCKDVWEELQSSTPAYQLVGDELVQFLRSLKTWDGASPLTLNFGTVQPPRIDVLVTGSVHLVGDVLSNESTKVLENQLEWSSYCHHYLPILLALTSLSVLAYRNTILMLSTKVIVMMNWPTGSSLYVVVRFSSVSLLILLPNQGDQVLKQVWCWECVRILRKWLNPPTPNMSEPPQDSYAFCENWCLRLVIGHLPASPPNALKERWTNGECGGEEKEGEAERAVSDQHSGVSGRYNHLVCSFVQVPVAASCRTCWASPWLVPLQLLLAVSQNSGAGPRLKNLYLLLRGPPACSPGKAVSLRPLIPSDCPLSTRVLGNSVLSTSKKLRNAARGGCAS
ncbi:Folylpolyglutamate synthase [Echinococcus granulosus]|uniref:Folylpolyglutamate synthase n=1 Tax=Echinococcus granulosus TaxID=6210 RepID=W6U966_ECHGR|nr:Folylpolyglutamate synthase [Echinococcus granulosus]EUB57046.1 Folylpolyglutamate synthase [Echinococcus granulosus]